MTDSLLVHNQKIEVEWHRWENSNKPTLVFLHEGLGCVSLWKDVPCTLSKMTRCNCFVYSRPGYGLSAPSALPRKINFMHTHALNFLPAVLKAAGIRDHIIIGHSDGGSIGIIYAGSSRAIHLKGMISEAAHVFCEPITRDAIKEARHHYQHNDLKTKLEKYHGRNTAAAFWGWNDVWLAPGFMHWNIEKFLTQIQVPTLAVQGCQDPYGTPEQLASISAGTIDCEAHLIDNCGHTPHQEQKDMVLSLMAKFIKKIIARC